MLGSRIAGVDSRRHRLAPDTGSPQHEVGLSTLSDTVSEAVEMRSHGEQRVHKYNEDD